MSRIVESLYSLNESHDEYIYTNEYQNTELPFMYYGDLIIPSIQYNDSGTNEYEKCLVKYAGSDLVEYEAINNYTGEILYRIPKDVPFFDSLLKDIKKLMDNKMWTSYELNSKLDDSLLREAFDEDSDVFERYYEGSEPSETTEKDNLRKQFEMFLEDPHSSGGFFVVRWKEDEASFNNKSLKDFVNNCN